MISHTVTEEAVELVLTRGLIIPQRDYYERRDWSLVERLAMDAPWSPEELASMKGGE